MSAYVRPEGPPGQIVERLLRDTAFEVVLSAEIVEEVLQGNYEVSAVSEDPDDDKYLAAAVEGRAALVVSGDPDLLVLEEHEGVRIVNPRAFLELL